MGSYQCKCQPDLVKGEEGVCVTREERDARRRARKVKKKKKKKKEEAESRGNEGEGPDGGGGGRVQYPWYYILGPLSGCYIVYKYWRPNVVTSTGIILFISVTATLSSY